MLFSGHNLQMFDDWLRLRLQTEVTETSLGKLTLKLLVETGKMTNHNLQLNDFQSTPMVVLVVIGGYPTSSGGLDPGSLTDLPAVPKVMVFFLCSWTV